MIATLPPLERIHVRVIHFLASIDVNQIETIVVEIQVMHWLGVLIVFRRTWIQAVLESALLIQIVKLAHFWFGGLCHGVGVMAPRANAN